jgi:pilus assembly protein TadC
VSVLLATLWAALVSLGVVRLRPAPVARIDDLVVYGGRARPWRDAVVRVRSAGSSAPAPSLVAGGAVFLVAALVAPPLALVLVAVVVARPPLQRRRVAARRQRGVERDVGDIVTMIGLAVNSGLNLLGALRAAGTYADGPVGQALRGVVAAVDRGVRLADALEPLPDDLGEVVRPMVIALVSCDRYGAPLGPTLDRLAVDMRIAARQRAEAAARRLPIQLLFPLVSCILPAFGLLTVAPLIAGSLRGLRL